MTRKICNTFYLDSLDEEIIRFLSEDKNRPKRFSQIKKRLKVSHDMLISRRLKFLEKNKLIGKFKQPPSYAVNLENEELRKIQDRIFASPGPLDDIFPVELKQSKIGSYSEFREGVKNFAADVLLPHMRVFVSAEKLDEFNPDLQSAFLTKDAFIELAYILWNILGIREIAYLEKYRKDFPETDNLTIDEITKKAIDRAKEIEKEMKSDPKRAKKRPKKELEKHDEYSAWDKKLNLIISYTPPSGPLQHDLLPAIEFVKGLKKMSLREQWQRVIHSKKR